MKHKDGCSNAKISDVAFHVRCDCKPAMTNPDNVGGLPELAEALAKRWRDDAKGFRERDMITAADDAEFYAEELEAILAPAKAGLAMGPYGPLSGEQEARMRGYCMTHLRTVEDDYPATGEFIREWLTHVENERNRLFELCRAAPAGGDELDTLLALVPRPAMAHHKMDEAEEREIKRVNRFRDRVIENIRAHCASRPDSAPAGSGEVEEMIERLESTAGAYPEDVFTPLTDDQKKTYGWVVQAASAGMGRHMAPLLLEAAALLRKLQQGAESKPKVGIPFEVLDRVPGQPADEVWLMQGGKCLGKFKVAASQGQDG